MLQKVPKLFAITSLLFVVGVLVYSINTNFVDSSLKGETFGRGSSSEKFKKRCCVTPSNTYLCALDCEHGAVEVPIIGSQNAICDNTLITGNCRKPPDLPPPPPAAPVCCNKGGGYICTTACGGTNDTVIDIGNKTCDTATTCPPRSSSSSAGVCCRSGMGTFCASKCQPGVKEIPLYGLVCGKETCNASTPSSSSSSSKLFCCDNPTGRVCATSCNGPSIPLDDGVACNEKTNCVSTPPPPPPPKQVYCCRARGSTLNLCVQATTTIGCGDGQQVINQTFLTYDDCEPMCGQKINSSTSSDR